MAGKCLTCAHASRREIDAALVAGQSLRALARQYGISRYSISDHGKNHLSESLRSAAARANEDAGDLLYRELGTIHRELRSILRVARKSGDLPSALGAVAGLMRRVEVLVRIQPPKPPTPPSFALRLEIGGPGRGSEEYSVRPATEAEFAARPALPAATDEGALEVAWREREEAGAAEPAAAAPAPPRGPVRAPKPHDPYLGGHPTTNAERIEAMLEAERQARDLFSGF
jgi:hypothetical protein